MKLTDIRQGSKPLEGIPLAEDHIFLARSTLNQLEQYGLVRPTYNEGLKARDLRDNDAYQLSHTVRGMIQRRFDRSRRARALVYADYIYSVYAAERLGGVPPITLFCSEQARYSDKQCALLLPARSALVNIDGETQTEARFILRDRFAESGDWTFGALLYHGITEEHAGQILHDANRYATPIGEAVVAPLNTEGNITQLIATVLKESNIPIGALNRYKPKPTKSREEITSFRTLIHGVVGALGGFEVLHKITKQISVMNNGRNDPASVEAARPFLKHVLTLISEDGAVGSSSPVIYGLFGAVFHDYGKLLTIDEWRNAAAAYTALKTDTRGLICSRLKQDAALRSLGLERQGDATYLLGESK